MRLPEVEDWRKVWARQAEQRPLLERRETAGAAITIACAGWRELYY
jgi:hypothetical protein